MGELDSGNIEGYLLRIGFKEGRLQRAKQAFAWNIQKLFTFTHFLADLFAQVINHPKLAFTLCSTIFLIFSHFFRPLFIPRQTISRGRHQRSYFSGITSRRSQPTNSNCSRRKPRKTPSKSDRKPQTSLWRPRASPSRWTSRIPKKPSRLQPQARVRDTS